MRRMLSSCLKKSWIAKDNIKLKFIAVHLGGFFNMSSEKVKCKKCNSEFLVSTSKETGGVCRGCKKGNSTIGDTLEAVELSFRLILAVVFAFFFTITGYGLGSEVWTGLGFFAAVVSFPIGFVIGFFFHEIRFLVRLIFGSFFQN